MVTAEGVTRRELAAIGAGAACQLLCGLAQGAAKPTYRPILLANTFIWVQQFQWQKKALAEHLDEALATIRRFSPADQKPR